MTQRAEAMERFTLLAIAAVFLLTLMSTPSMKDGKAGGFFLR